MSSFQGIGDPTLSESVGKRLMTPGGAVAPGVAPELMPCLVIENDRPENLHLSSSERYCRSVSAAAGGAGTRSSVRLFVRSPDLLVVLERIEVVVASGSMQIRNERLGAGVLPFGSFFSGIPNDTRNLGNSQAEIIADTTLAAAGTLFYTGTGTSLVVERPFILTGVGNSIYICPTVDNVAISICTFWWRERRLNPSERF